MKNFKGGFGEYIHKGKRSFGVVLVKKSTIVWHSKNKREIKTFLDLAKILKIKIYKETE